MGAKHHMVPKRTEFRTFNVTTKRTSKRTTKRTLRCTAGIFGGHTVNLNSYTWYRYLVPISTGYRYLQRARRGSPPRLVLSLCGSHLHPHPPKRIFITNGKVQEFGIVYVVEVYRKRVHVGRKWVYFCTGMGICGHGFSVFTEKPWQDYRFC